MLSSFGDIIFEVSDKKVYTIDNLSRKVSLNYEEQEVQGGLPKIYIKNVDLIDISFSIKLVKAAGVDIPKEVKAWLDLLASKTPRDFILNNTKIGDKWLLVSVNENSEIIDEVVTLDIELKQFAGSGSAKTKKDDKKASADKVKKGRSVKSKPGKQQKSKKKEKEKRQKKKRQPQTQTQTQAQ